MKAENKYSFNPLKHGFEAIENYPELGFNWDIKSKNLFVKIVCYDNFGDLVYWYKVIRTNVGFGDDDRVQIDSGGYDFRQPSEYGKQTKPRIEYLGLISNDQFAKNLLKHLLGTTKNDSLKTTSISRYNESLGKKMRAEFSKYYNR